MKRLLLMVVIILSLYGCATLHDGIAIKGDIETFVDIDTEYIDKGVNYDSNKFVLIQTGNIDTTKLGKYKINYKVYSKEGELVKELYRFVYVVDRVPPTYVENDSIDEYYVGNFDAKDFFKSYSDNCSLNISLYSKDVTLSPDKIKLKEGNNYIQIILKDASGNETIYRKDLVAKFDLWKLIEKVYKDDKNKLSYDNVLGEEEIRVSIDNQTSFSYYEGTTIHYIKSYKDSRLGSYSSIQISAEYGKFNNASINYHISKESKYSVGFAYIDGTKVTGNIISFNGTINNLNLNEAQMVNELNDRLEDFLSSFHDYMNNTLGIEVK